MARLGMVIDTRRCVGCMDCVVACKTENQTPEGMNRDWITTATKGRFPQLSMTIRSERCNHCDDPPCVTCCPTGASHVHEWGGVVLVTKEECIGCKACLASCPYDARYVHPEGYADKCTFCIHRVEKGQDPPASRSAPPTACTSATSTTPSPGEPPPAASRRHHAVLPEAGTKPRIFYLE